MERLYETDSVMFEYSPNSYEGEYRLSVFDKYGHYDNEVWLDEIHLRDLKKMFESIDFHLKEEQDIL